MTINSPTFVGIGIFSGSFSGQTVILSGSFSGSFAGNGGQLTNINSASYALSASWSPGSAGSINLDTVVSNGNTTSLPITIGSTLTLTDPSNAVIQIDSLTDDRTYDFPDRSGYIQVGENYKKYVALLEQSASLNPMATVLENTLAGTPTWARAFAGTFVASLSGAFPEYKTWCSITVPTDDYGSAYLRRSSNNEVVATYADNIGPGSSGYIVCVEIRVYP